MRMFVGRLDLTVTQLDSTRPSALHSAAAWPRDRPWQAKKNEEMRLEIIGPTWPPNTLMDGAINLHGFGFYLVSPIWVRLFWRVPLFCGLKLKVKPPA